MKNGKWSVSGRQGSTLKRGGRGAKRGRRERKDMAGLRRGPPVDRSLSSECEERQRCEVIFVSQGGREEVQNEREGGEEEGHYRAGEGVGWKAERLSRQSSRALICVSHCLPIVINAQRDTDSQSPPGTLTNVISVTGISGHKGVSRSRGLFSCAPTGESVLPPLIGSLIHSALSLSGVTPAVRTPVIRHMMTDHSGMIGPSHRASAE